MGKKDDLIVLEGVIAEAYPNATFKVTLIDEETGEETERSVLGHISGRIRRNFIKINPGDMVTVEISPYDLTKGRIVKRH